MAPELEDFVLHCLEKRPEERFQSARDLAFSLRVLEREAGAGSHARSDGTGRPAARPGSGAAPSAASIAVRAVASFHSESA